MKRLMMIAAAVAVLGLAAAAVGGAGTSAQEGDGPVGSFLAKVADKLGVSEEELKTAIDETRIETIDEAVAEGRLTEEQAERLKERTDGGGFLFPRPLEERRFHPRPVGHILDAAAEVLDMPEDALVQELKDGNSLADVAEAQGMDAEEFEAALLDQVQAQLDDAVADGTITQEQADRISEDMEERIDRIVHTQPKTLGPCPPRHRPDPGGPEFGPSGFDGPLPFEMPEQEESSEVTA
jgi:polyhydroxyalkanoate synthesis regulator phasin